MWDWMEWNAMTPRVPAVLKIIANIYVKIFKAQTSSIMKVRLYDKVACILHECGLSAPDKVGKLLGKHFFFPVGSSH